MGALFVHLLLAAYVAPVIGGVLSILLGPVLFSKGMSDVRPDGILFVAFFTPLLCWYIFVPLGCCSFWFFRRAATLPRKSVMFWVISWAVIGGISGAVFAATTGGHSLLWFFTVAGAATGIVFAPIHRRVWTQIYPEYYLKFPIK
jgi:hypothetical protein